MKRLTFLVLLLLSFQLFTAGAYDISVNSASETSIVLAVSDLNTIDIQLGKVVATVETETVSDTYIIGVTAKTEGEEVLVIADVSPIFKDYTSEQVKAITVSGTITIEGENVEFGKRVSYRGAQNNLQGAPIFDEDSSALIYSIVGLSLVLVFLILILFYNKPKQTAIIRREKKRPKKKKQVVKKKTRKKTKKRL